MILGSVDRAMKVFEILNGYPDGLRLSELAERLDTTQSTAHHVLSTMVPYGYVQQDPETRRDSLGLRFLQVGQTIASNFQLRKITHRHLEKLRTEVEGATHVAILKDDKVTYVDKTDWSGGLTLATYIGFTTDAEATAGGKLLLSTLSDGQVDDLYRDKEFSKYTDKSIGSLSELKEVLTKCREQGYAVDDEEYYEGIHCVAVPIYAGNKVIAALSVTSSVFAYSMEEMTTKVRARAEAAARAISADLY